MKIFVSFLLLFEYIGCLLFFVRLCKSEPPVENSFEEYYILVSISLLFVYIMVDITDSLIERKLFSTTKNIIKYLNK